MSDTAVTAEGLGEPEEDDLVDDRPGVALAGLPASLIVSGLMDQLSKFSTGYSSADYLSPVLSAASLLRGRHNSDPDVMSDLTGGVGAILDSVASEIERDWGVDFSQLGLDPGSADYEQDVLELYRFSVCGRLQNARKILYRAILSDRRRIADRFRRDVEKRNQTVAEARRTFQNFDDVVVWVSIPQVLDDIRSSETWSFPLGDALARCDFEPASQGALASAARGWDRRDFSLGFVRPALSTREAATATALDLKCRWLADSPKKNAED